MGGMLDKIKSGAKKVKNTVGKIASAKSRRKYVWNDFSIGLEKAKLHILEATNLDNTTTSLDNIDFVELDTLYVQINPPDFKFEYGLSRSSPEYSTTIDSTKIAGMPPGVTFSQEGCNRDFSLSLNYDIYDEFMARTGNESYPDLSGFSLYDDKATSLHALVALVQAHKCFAQFVWGPVKKFGIISKVGVTYTAFSRWGDPLKAVAEVNIQEWFLAEGDTINIGSQTIDDLDKLSGGEKAAKVGKNIIAGAANIFR